MKNERITSLCNFVCAVLLLVTLVMLFQPFWTCSDCKSHKGVDKEVSLAEYLWFPGEHEPITDEMTDLYRDIYGKDYRDANGRKFKFRANEILPSVLTAFLGSVAGIACCVFFHKKFFIAGIPLVVGLAGILGFTSCPALKVGQNVQTHLIIAIIVTAVAAISLILGAVLAIQQKRKTVKA